ncbi:MAG: alpha/beta fold hydrolase, partial [Bdellovibrionales bacterium]
MSKELNPIWQHLPPTPRLPKSYDSGYAEANEIKLWYATYGQGEPIILLHGGLANSNYWGNQIAELAQSHRVIVIDSRGHGRSTRNVNRPYSYNLMANDVVTTMDFLHVPNAAVVGWSDGAMIGLKMAINYPDRISS